MSHNSKQGCLSTPFSHARPAPNPKGTGNPGVYDKHTTPVLSQPRSVGKDAAREKFFEDISADPAALSTPMGTAAVEPRRPLSRKK